LILSKEELVALYHKRASNYDFTANLYYLIGYRERAYRKRAVEALSLGLGDTVVEIACGTGLNFGLLREAVGPQGRVVGVDINGAMLAQARKRVERRAWSNVELVQSDAAAFEFPESVDGVISTFAITLVPEFDGVIQRGVSKLAPGRRFVILDFKRPDWPPLWLVKAFVRITAPFGVSLELAERHPWESLERYSGSFQLEELYWGFTYLAVGQDASVELQSADSTASTAFPYLEKGADDGWQA